MRGQRRGNLQPVNGAQVRHLSAEAAPPPGAIAWGATGFLWIYILGRTLLPLQGRDFFESYLPFAARFLALISFQAFAVTLSLALVLSLPALLRGEASWDDRMRKSFRAFALWVLPLIAAATGYFVLKLKGATSGNHFPLHRIEGPIWRLQRPLLEALPAEIYRVLDWIYMPGYVVTHLPVAVLPVIASERVLERFHGTATVLFAISAFIHLTLPVLSPIYTMGDYFSFLPGDLGCFHHHAESLRQQTLFLREGPAALLREGIAVPRPIAAFPSLHVGYCYLLYLITREFCTGCFWGCALAFASLIAAGSIVLGYHYFADGLAGILLVAVVYRGIESVRS